LGGSEPVEKKTEEEEIKSTLNSKLKEECAKRNRHPNPNKKELHKSWVTRIQRDIWEREITKKGWCGSKIVFEKLDGVENLIVLRPVKKIEQGKAVPEKLQRVKNENPLMKLTKAERKKAMKNQGISSWIGKKIKFS